LPPTRPLLQIGSDLVDRKSMCDHCLNNKEIAAILRGYQDYPLGMIDNTSEFRISITGAQEKAAFLYHNHQWCRPLRDTPTSHIFKIPFGFIQHQ
jgi:serine/threonine-protein kinase HipA